jgi:hypothetical protein
LFIRHPRFFFPSEKFIVVSIFIICFGLFKQMKYVADDSTTFWAIGPDSGVIAKHAEICGKEVEMVVPFEGVTSGEVRHAEFHCD